MLSANEGKSQHLGLAGYRVPTTLVRGNQQRNRVSTVGRRASGVPRTAVWKLFTRLLQGARPGLENTRDLRPIVVDFVTSLKAEGKIGFFGDLQASMVPGAGLHRSRISVQSLNSLLKLFCGEILTDDFRVMS